MNDCPHGAKMGWLVFRIRDLHIRSDPNLDSRMETTRPLARAGYLLAALLVVLPLFDAITHIMPFHFDDARWRFQTLGNLSNVTMVPLLGLFVALAFAWWARDPRTRRSIGALCAVLAIVVAGIAIAFIVNYFGVRAQIPPRLAHVAALASIAAVIKELLAVIVLALFAFAALRDRSASAGNASGAPVSR